MEKFYFTIVAGIVALTDLLLAFIVYSKKSHSDNYLGTTLLMAAEVNITYAASACTTDYFLMSVYSSLYFSGISVMLLFLLHFILAYTNLNKIKKRHYIIFYMIISAWTVADVIINLLNPFCEISISYILRENSVAMWQYKPGFLYSCHLIFCYILIALIFTFLIVRTAKTPRVYRPKFLTVLFGILFVVVLNGAFLFFQNENMLDYSILFYSLIGYFIFWARFIYSHHGMLAPVRQMILNELEQPVLLFDRDDELVLSNNLAGQFVSAISEKNRITLESFTKKMKLPESILSLKNDLHFQWAPETQDNRSIYRVDVKRLTDRKDRTIGKLIVMTDNSLELDILTGFHTKNTFESHFHSANDKIKLPAAIVICDLNKLSIINKNLGQEQGDKAIQKLAELMKKHFPSNSYFARLEEANLLAICPETTAEKMREFIAYIRTELDEVTEFGQHLEIQSAISVADKNKPDILEATETAMFSMRSKKLMDGGSSHSSLIDSLAQTLLESDNTTRAHVQRTREMGELLGKRLHFSDIQLSNLALLCLLHDIGKLGIPLEILNKPGKLNNAEWTVMKSHVEKGYRIAKASPELQEIADLILHHHESWNGKGYPDGLKQESIPLLSRVIAVVDTYDAMTNDRPYHKAVTDWEAREELRRCSGVQFDPSIVSEFLALLEELNPIENKPHKAAEQNMAKAQIETSQGVNEIFSSTSERAKAMPIDFSRYILDSQNKIISIDEKFQELTGYDEKDLETYNLSQIDLIPPEDATLYKSIADEQVEKSGQAYIEHRILRKDGSTKDVVCFGKQFFDSVSREPRTEIVAFDVSITNAFNSMKKTERESAKRTYEKWEHLLRKDSLTGILNHEAFINDVEIELTKEKQKTVLMIIDVDYFKNYNDNFGHLAGDQLLSLVAIMLETAVKEYGFAGRLGGDEFAAVINLPENTPKEKITKLVDQTFSTVINATNHQEHGASISMGAAVLENPKGFNKLYQAADRALYKAKEKGRKCWFM